jgi:hypothetical protein
MKLFRSKKPARLDPPQAAEALKVAITKAIGEAEARHVAPSTIIGVLKAAIGMQEYVAAVSARSSWDTTHTIEHIR